MEQGSLGYFSLCYNSVTRSWASQVLEPQFPHLSSGYHTIYHIPTPGCIQGRIDTETLKSEALCKHVALKIVEMCRYLLIQFRILKNNGPGKCWSISLFYTPTCMSCTIRTCMARTTQPLWSYYLVRVGRFGSSPSRSFKLIPSLELALIMSQAPSSLIVSGPRGRMF